MSTALAESLPPRRFAAARTLRVAIVAADDSCPDIVRMLVAGPAQPAAVRDISTLAADPPDAVVFVADFATATAVAALRRVRGDVAAGRVVVVARGDASGIAARQALNAGAEAFVPADIAEQALGPALEAVMAGLVCAPRATRRLVAKPTFSHREKEVLELLVMGLTNRQIGARLFLAESTVKSHLASAFAKLGVGARKDAVALLLDPAEGLGPTALPPAAVSRGLV
jgi:DNA-binding NarL/FixJ family response regulator